MPISALACDHSTTEIHAIRNTGFYSKFQCKSDPVIRNSDPDKRVLLHRKGACDSELGKNDPVSRMIQLSVSQSSGVYCIKMKIK